MYKLTNSNSIIRLSDNASIPLDEGNTDYQAYLSWLEAGNVPAPLDVPAPLTAKQQAIKDILALEATVTERRIREAILGTDNGWLAGVNAQIAVLRAVQ